MCLDKCLLSSRPAVPCFTNPRIICGFVTSESYPLPRNFMPLRIMHPASGFSRVVSGSSQHVKCNQNQLISIISPFASLRCHLSDNLSFRGTILPQPVRFRSSYSIWTPPGAKAVLLGYCSWHSVGSRFSWTIPLEIINDRSRCDYRDAIFYKERGIMAHGRMNDLYVSPLPRNFGHPICWHTLSIPRRIVLTSPALC